MKLESGRGRAGTRTASEAGWREPGTRRDVPRASHRAPRARPLTDAADDDPRHLRLSSRELEVFHMLVDGLAVNEVSHALHLSERTVATHVVQILHKLALDVATDLLPYAVRHGLIDEGVEGA